MPEFANAGDGAPLPLIVRHDDAKGEYDYPPAQGLTATNVGAFAQAVYDESVKQGRILTSVKNDWKRTIFFA